ncbi:MAG: hypothetical protein Q7S36_03480 [Candidatus Liptonbacteria bacterium]|nr:hypothetical protein [Candidatus Liptonbacteria bacterium]
MFKLWSRLLGFFYKTGLRIGIILWIMPVFVVKYWYLIVVSFAPFACMALYHHTWTPYIWWWGVAFTGVVAFVALAVKLRRWPNC